MSYTEKSSFSRSELYEMAWAKPMTMLGRELSLPPLTVSGILRGMDIPLPPSGHWQKVAAGKPYERPDLPDPEREVSREFDVVRLDGGETWEELPIPPARKLEPYEEFERESENAIVVAEALDEPHKLVRDAQRVLAKGEVDPEYGWVRPRSSSWKPRLDVDVSAGRVAVRGPEEPRAQHQRDDATERPLGRFRPARPRRPDRPAPDRHGRVRRH